MELSMILIIFIIENYKIYAGAIYFQKFFTNILVFIKLISN